VVDVTTNADGRDKPMTEIAPSQGREGRGLPRVAARDVEPSAGRAVDQARTTLRSNGLRCTAPRVAVVSVVFADTPSGHLTAAEIIERLEKRGEPADLTTVYRTLALLVERGVFHALTVGDRVTTYGLAEAPHHHAVCTNCGAVIEVPAERLSTALVHASRGSRFELGHDAGMTLHGLCPNCQNAVD